MQNMGLALNKPEHIYVCQAHNLLQHLQYVYCILLLRVSSPNTSVLCSHYAAVPGVCQINSKLDRLIE